MTDGYLSKAWEIAASSGITSDSWEDWSRFFAASTFWPIGKEGEIVGFLMFHGMPDGTIMMHTIVESEWLGKWVTKTMVKAFRGWDPGLDVVTLVAPEIERVVVLIGFKDSGRVEGDYKVFIKQSKIRQEGLLCQQ